MKLKNKTSLNEMRKKSVSACSAERYRSFRISDSVYATIMILGLLGCCPNGYAQAAMPGGRAQFEPACVAVPAGNSCTLHPEGDPDPKQSIRVNSDEDGVARFLAVRPTQPNSVDRLALDCTDSNGSSQTYSVDLRSEATFGPRPFNTSLVNAIFRPGLAGDPLSYTQQGLITGGYGLRPDPDQNPAGYQRWLATAIIPVYKLPGHRPSSRAANSPAHPMPQRSVDSIPHEIDANVITSPSNFWTGPRGTSFRGMELDLGESLHPAGTFGFRLNSPT